MFLAVLLFGCFAGFTLPEYYLVVFASAVALGLLAAATDLSFGLGGILTLGPSLPFGVGSYVAAVSTKAGLSFFPSLVIAAVTGTAIFAFLSLVGLSRQRSSTQFALFTLVASVTCEQIAISSESVLGGSNGLTNIAIPLGLDLRIYFFVFLLVLTGLGTTLIFILIKNEELLILQRDEPQKAVALGYDPKRIKVLLMMATGGVGAAVGGAHVPLSGIAYPGLFAALPNLLVLVCIAIGGRGTLVGPFIAAIVFTLIQFELGSANSNLYLLLVGVLFILAVVFAPNGLWPDYLRSR